MVSINLLPWRAYARRYQQQVLRKLLLSVFLLTLLLIVCLHWITAERTQALQLRVTTLEQASQPLLLAQKQWKASSDSGNEAVMKALLNYRYATKKLFAELGRIKADTLCFTQIVRARGRISFAGQAHSAAELTAFLTGWRAAYLFSEIRVEQLEQQENHLIRFRFQAMENTLFLRALSIERKLLPHAL